MNKYKSTINYKSLTTFYFNLILKTVKIEIYPKKHPIGQPIYLLIFNYHCVDYLSLERLFSDLFSSPSRLNIISIIISLHFQINTFSYHLRSYWMWFSFRYDQYLLQSLHSIPIVIDNNMLEFLHAQGRLIWKRWTIVNRNKGEIDGNSSCVYFLILNKNQFNAKS